MEGGRYQGDVQQPIREGDRAHMPSPSPLPNPSLPSLFHIALSPFPYHPPHYVLRTPPLLPSSLPPSVATPASSIILFSLPHHALLHTPPLLPSSLPPSVATPASSIILFSLPHHALLHTPPLLPSSLPPSDPTRASSIILVSLPHAPPSPYLLITLFLFSLFMFLG